MYERELGPNGIRQLISRWRRMLRWLATIEGAGVLCMGGLLLFWLHFGFDVLFEPTVPWRLPLTLALLLGLAALYYRFVLSVWRADPTDAELALVLESRLPQLQDRLMTAIELDAAHRPENAGSPALVEATIRQTRQLLYPVRLGRLVHWRPILTWWTCALALAAVVVVAVVCRNDFFRIWVARTLTLADTRYPRHTRLQLVGIEGPTHRVAIGRDFELEVNADSALIVPDRVAVDFWMLKSRVGASPFMTKVGVNHFRHVFRSVLEPISFTVRGGDDESEQVVLEAVPPPLLESVIMAVTYPPYVQRPPEEFSLQGTALSLPRGSHVQLKMTASKPLESLSLTSKQSTQNSDSSTAAAEMVVERQNSRHFTASFELDQSLPLEANFRDLDGIVADPPVPVDLVVVEDKPPTLRMALEGIGTLITPAARVPLRLEVVDDYGLGELSFAITIERASSKEANDKEASPKTAAESRTLPIELAAKELSARSQHFRGIRAIEIPPLELKAGDRLTLIAVASDRCELPAPQQARSEPIVFDVVTAEDLLGQLATRELNLRQRFEQMVREVTQVRQQLAQLSSQSAAKPNDPEGLVALYADRALQALRKSANEASSIFAGFRMLRDELVNNRIENTSLIDRLEQGILVPMERLIAGDFPAAGTAIAAVSSQATARPGAAAPSDQILRAEGATDEVLARCQEILRAMLKMESFNELVAMLRELIDEQDRLTEKTRQEEKKRILDLLE